MKSNYYLKLSFLIACSLSQLSSQGQYSWIYFSDKCSESEDYFTQAVCPEYIDSLKNLGYRITGTSKWLNAVCVEQTDEPIDDLSFVCHVEELGNYTTNSSAIDEEYAYGYSDWALEMLNLDSFHRLGYTGKQVKLALFDGGFYKVDSLPQFDSLWIKGQIKNNYDFERDSALNFRESRHGMQVLSLVASQYPDSLYGASPDADFYLARTEVTQSEKHIEEYNWVKAMEWADSLKVNIIHSSLGYSRFDSLEGDYSYADMDGQSTIITIAAEQAANRGIFVTNSAGNQGKKSWKFITAPCDGEHVLCVGAVDSFKNKADFSSIGPSSDGRVKPDVMALGVKNSVPDISGILSSGSGTSFSGPIIAGMVACLMQAHPGRSNEAIFQAIIKSTDRYNNPDSFYGYGIPDVLKADSILRETASIQDNISTEIKIAPNPASEYVRIICEPGTRFELSTFSGHEVQNGTLNNWMNFIDTKDLSPGMYVFRFMIDQNWQVYKLIVQ